MTYRDQTLSCKHYADDFLVDMQIYNAVLDKRHIQVFRAITILYI